MNWSPEEKSFVERAIAWTSISYAFGFLIVLLHTSRLGLPVLELVRPIFVWVGLPLALVTFFSARLWRLIQARMAVLRAELELFGKGIPQSLVASPFKDSSPPAVIDRIAREVSQAMPIVLPRKGMVYVFRRALENILKDLPAIPGGEAALAKAGERVVRMLRTLTAVRHFLNSVIFVAVIIAGITAYVWKIYPRIPQPMGGGAPMSIRLAVKADAVPDSVRALLRASVVSSEAKGPFLTDPIQLIYNAKDAAYLRTSSGRTLSITQGGVVGIIWN